MNANNLSILCQMNALVAEMEGMKAYNAAKLISQETGSYDESDFQRVADSLKELASFTTSE